MYNNSGSKVMSLANTLSVLVMVIGALAGIAVWLLMMGEDNGLIGFFVGAFIFGINALVGWIIYLTLYAFGELVYKTAQIEELLRTHLASGNSQSGAKSSAAPVSSGGTSPKPAPAPRPTGSITCPFCKKVYPAGTIFCPDCNAQIGSKR